MGTTPIFPSTTTPSPQASSTSTPTMSKWYLETQTYDLDAVPNFALANDIDISCYPLAYAEIVVYSHGLCPSGYTIVNVRISSPTAIFTWDTAAYTSRQIRATRADCCPRSGSHHLCRW